MQAIDWKLSPETVGEKRSLACLDKRLRWKIDKNHGNLVVVCFYVEIKFSTVEFVLCLIFIHFDLVYFAVNINKTCVLAKYWIWKCDHISGEFY